MLNIALDAIRVAQESTVIYHVAQPLVFRARLENTVPPTRLQVNVRAKAANQGQFNQIQVMLVALNVEVVCLQITL